VSDWLYVRQGQLQIIQSPGLVCGRDNCRTFYPGAQAAADCCVAGLADKGDNAGGNGEGDDDMEGVNAEPDNTGEESVGEDEDTATEDDEDEE